MVLPKFKTFDILLPLSWIYSGAVSLRNWAFERGYLHQESFEDRVPVICVGNLAAGGTGKTPHIEYLIRLLQREGIERIAVLSRGYKRQSKGFVLASEDVSSLKLGDESYQLFRKFQDIIVAVDEDRVHGIKRLLSMPEQPSVILLDDAFQHRYVKAGLSICLTSYHRILYRDKVIPAGYLREPANGILRADLVVVTKCPPQLRDEEETEILSQLPVSHEQPIMYSTYRYGRLINLQSMRPVDVDPRVQVLIVSGIADPTDMENYVQKHFRLLDILSFGDHHRFTSRDIREMEQRLNSVNEQGYCTNSSGEKPIIITTEKDAARLVDHKSVSSELKQRIYYLPTEVYFLQDHENKFNKKILDYVRKNRTNSQVHPE